MTQNTYYDNTRLSCYKTCPRQYYFRHLRNWRKKGISAPLAFGLSWHAAQDVIWGLVGKKPDDEVAALAYARFLETWIEEDMPHPDDMDFDKIEELEPRTPQIGAEMIVNYIFARKEFITSCDEIVAIEQPFAIPLYPGESNTKFYIGRIDKLVKRGGRIYPIEHKTTSMYKGRAPDHQLRPDYIEQWSLNSQVDGYLNATFMNHGKTVDSIYVDAALVHKKTHDVFKFIPVKRALSHMDGWLYDAREWVRRVETDIAELESYQAAVEDGAPHASFLPAFAKNTESCQGKYNSTCSYFDLCRYWNNPEEHTLPDGFIEEEWNPFDLLDIKDVPGHEGGGDA